MFAFVEKLNFQKDFSFTGSITEHYKNEIKTLFEDLKKGGNKHITKTIAFKIWLGYRLKYQHSTFSTQSAVKANNNLCKRYNIIYAGPILF